MATPEIRPLDSYQKELSDEEIDNKVHREFVGGLWEELGRLQFDFLREQGLQPDHKLLDIGCGCLRGGLFLIEHLDPGNYCGLDINHSLIRAGLREVKEAGLTEKKPTLLVDNQFNIARFEQTFDYMLSVSVFTHLPMNSIIRCLCEAKAHLNPDGVYYASFFQAPTSACLELFAHQPGGVVTSYDADPFHYSFDELSWMAGLAGLRVRLIGDWKHPRNQRMAAFAPR